MQFTKNHIQPEIYHIIDIGTYKLRAISIRIKNKRTQILKYVEKRQDASYFRNNECINYIGLSENISDIILSLEADKNEKKPKTIFIYPFGEIFSRSKTLNYKRSSPHTPLNIKELEKIVESVEKLCLKKVAWEIYENYGRDLHEIQIILSKLWTVKIDNKSYSKILGREWELMKIAIQNIFIPVEKYDSLIKIWHSIGIKIHKIMPSEYCMSHVFKEKDMCIIDIWASSTNISIKKSNEILSMTKVPIGIGNLIEKIKSSTPYSKSQIIESLDNESVFIDERNSFVRIWQRSIGIALYEMLEWEVCPYKFFIHWGWNNNDFIRNAVENLDFPKYEVKITKKVELISEDMWDILSDIEHVSLEQIKKIPLDMFAVILETKNMLMRKWDIMSSSLENAVHKLGY